MYEYDVRADKIALEFMIESVHFRTADNHVGFYELFILWLKCIWKKTVRNMK